MSALRNARSVGQPGSQICGPNYIGIFRVHVEQSNSMRSLAPVDRGVTRNGNMEVMPEGVHGGCANAARGRAAGNGKRVPAKQAQGFENIRPEKRTRLALSNKAGNARNGGPGRVTAGSPPALDRVKHRLRPVGAEISRHIDHQQRGPVSRPAVVAKPDASMTARLRSVRNLFHLSSGSVAHGLRQFMVQCTPSPPLRGANTTTRWGQSGRYRAETGMGKETNQ